jgi:hypothetical protein
LQGIRTNPHLSPDAAATAAATAAIVAAINAGENITPMAPPSARKRLTPHQVLQFQRQQQQQQQEADDPPFAEALLQVMLRQVGCEEVNNLKDDIAVLRQFDIQVRTAVQCAPCPCQSSACCTKLHDMHDGSKGPRSP